MATCEYSYPSDLTIEYSNDFEYRKSLRQLFHMNSQSYPDIVKLDIDKVSRDELEYDDDASDKAMEYVINQTRNNPLFHVLYEQAATFMFSTNVDIGLAVLFSYDYLLLFHNCLTDYFKSLRESDNTFTNQNVNYTLLYNKLFAKR